MYKCFFDVFIAVAVVSVATALYFDLKGQSVILITYGSKNPKMYKLVYSETTGHYENVPVLLRGTFYTYSKNPRVRTYIFQG